MSDTKRLGSTILINRESATERYATLIAKAHIVDTLVEYGVISFIDSSLPWLPEYRFEWITKTELPVKKRTVDYDE